LEGPVPSRIGTLIQSPDASTGRREPPPSGL